MAQADPKWPLMVNLRVVSFQARSLQRKFPGIFHYQQVRLLGAYPWMLVENLSSGKAIFLLQALTHDCDHILAVALPNCDSEHWFDIVEVYLVVCDRICAQGIDQSHTVKHNQPHRESISRVIVIEREDPLFAQIMQNFRRTVNFLLLRSIVSYNAQKFTITDRLRVRRIKNLKKRLPAITDTTVPISLRIDINKIRADIPMVGVIGVEVLHCWKETFEHIVDWIVQPNLL